MSAPADPLHDVFVVRQPIGDAQREVIGYELLVGDGEGAVDPGEARASTAQLLVDAFAEIGLDTLVGDRPAFLKVSRDFLVDVQPLPLRPDRVVLELDCSMPPDPVLLGVLKRLAARGFTFALHAFAYDPELEPLLALAAFVKLRVDVLGPTALAREVGLLARHEVTLLAEGVHTHEELARCQELGFAGWQGPVLSRPRLVRGRGLPTGRLGMLRTVSDLNAPDIGLPELESIIRSDVGLAFKLLRYVNSAFFSMPNQIESVHHAVSMLGERMTRRWATVMAMSSDHDTPHELLAVALLRARMCELLGDDRDHGRGEAYFTTGLFSVMDALLDAPMLEVLGELPVSGEIKRGLLGHGGPMGEVLAEVLAYEAGDFAALDVRPGSLSSARAYREALTWAMYATSGLRPGAPQPQPA